MRKCDNHLPVIFGTCGCLLYQSTSFKTSARSNWGNFLYWSSHLANSNGILKSFCIENLKIIWKNSIHSSRWDFIQCYLIFADIARSLLNYEKQPISSADNWRLRFFQTIYFNKIIVFAPFKQRKNNKNINNYLFFLFLLFFMFARNFKLTHNEN